MTTLMQASRQWATRPAEERFLSLLELQAFTHRQLENSRSSVFSSRKLEVLPDETDPKMRGLLVGNPDGTVATPTHWSFGQLCTLAATPSPASYFRESKLPSPIIADCLNFNLRFTRDVEDVKLLVSGQSDGVELRAATGPRYGRIWNADVVDALVERFGDGVSGHWRVPGIFGERITVDNGNTTLGARFFLFDYVCCNRYVWGADQYTEVRIRHTSGAPDRWIEEVTPVLREYAEGSAKPVLQAIEDARSKRIEVDLDQFLAKRFGKSLVPALKAVHETEEGRPIETLWDVTVAATAHARSLPNNDKRLELERSAGELLKQAA